MSLTLNKTKLLKMAGGREWHVRLLISLHRWDVGEEGYCGGVEGGLLQLESSRCWIQDGKLQGWPYKGFHLSNSFNPSHL